MRVKVLAILIGLIFFTINISAQEPGDSINITETRADSTLVIVPKSTATNPSGPIINPVDIDEGQRPVILHYYDKHGNPLPSPVLFLEEDTVKKASPKPVFPAYAGTEIGVNFADLIMMAFGQKYSNYDLRANVSIYNWFFPTIECGLGFANDTPDNQNYTYKTKPSFYTKIGLDYNFLYKSNPKYRLFIGLRGGWSTFKYDIENITISSDYWDQTQQFNLENISANALWGEVLAGLRVNIISRFSLGWEIRWHFPFHVTETNGSKPWFIPGYGTGNFAISIAASWSF
ncbi:MAG: hypothetical protein K2M87_08550 [Muribaculaceae bacterium]|nr:hypothetical protein [Muribaculaceae bacterium]